MPRLQPKQRSTAGHRICRPWTNDKRDGGFGAPVHRSYGKLALDRAYDSPGAKTKLGAKDTKLVLQAGEALSVPLPVA